MFYRKALREKNRMQMKKVLIVDDDMRFRRYVKELFASEEGLQIIGEAANGKEAVRKAKELKPSLVLMDISMPWMSGLDATRQLKKIIPKLAVIILTIHDLEGYREAAMARGACAYVLKKDMMEELIPAIRMALS
jgi:DNA-binding NarL/FixJ family response regulator